MLCREASTQRHPNIPVSPSPPERKSCAGKKKTKLGGVLHFVCNLQNSDQVMIRRSCNRGRRPMANNCYIPKIFLVKVSKIWQFFSHAVLNRTYFGDLASMKMVVCCTRIHIWILERIKSHVDKLRGGVREKSTPQQNWTHNLSDNKRRPYCTFHCNPAGGCACLSVVSFHLQHIVEKLKESSFDKRLHQKLTLRSADWEASKE